MDSIQTSWGSRLRSERKKLGYTQVDFAKLANVSTVTYQQYEREEFEPRLSFLYKLTDLGVDIYFVLFGKSRESVDDSIDYKELEVMAFNLLIEYLNKHSDEKNTADGLFALFRFFKSEITSVAKKKSSPLTNLNGLMENILPTNSLEKLS